MKSNNHNRLKFACYSMNVSMSVISNLTPVLFITFKTLYGISYTLLGTLVLINFISQLTIDLIFSFFSHKFNISMVVKIMPILTVIGLLLFAILPLLFPSIVFLGLAIGTVIFSVSSGLAEVLISPIIAAIPSKNPERAMSSLHSFYAWGVVGVIIISTVFLLLADARLWYILPIGFTTIPLLSAILFVGSKLPEMETPEQASGVAYYLKQKGLWLCFLILFLSGASEITMGQWSSGYIENALKIPKIWGDIAGAAMFSLTLGLGRSLYAKFGKNLEKVLLISFIGAAICYLTVALVNIPLIGLIACALTGLCTAMLWPGNLVVASKRFPQGGVFLYAMMAAGGDLGASVAPQLVGAVSDIAANSTPVINLATTLGLSAEQLGMKIGMLTASGFPIIGIFLSLIIIKRKNNKKTQNTER